MQAPVICKPRSWSLIKFGKEFYLDKTRLQEAQKTLLMVLLLPVTSVKVADAGGANVKVIIICFQTKATQMKTRPSVKEVRVGPQYEKSSNLYITADSTGSIHKNARGKKFDPKKVRLGCGDLI